MALQLYFEDSGFAHVKLKDTEFAKEKWRLMRVLLAGCKLPKIKNPSDTQQNKKIQTKGKHTRKWNKNRTTTVDILNLSHSKHTTNVTSDVLQEMLKVREAELSADFPGAVLPPWGTGSLQRAAKWCISLRFCTDQALS